MHDLAAIIAGHVPQTLTQGSDNYIVIDCLCGEAVEGVMSFEQDITTTGAIMQLLAPHVAAVIREAHTVRTVAELDAMPVGTVVLSVNPRLVPSGSGFQFLGNDEPGGPWWLFGLDGSFMSKDVLYGGSVAIVPIVLPEQDV